MYQFCFSTQWYTLHRLPRRPQKFYANETIRLLKVTYFSLTWIPWIDTYIDNIYTYNHDEELLYMCVYIYTHMYICLNFIRFAFFFLKIDWLIDWLLCWVFVSVLRLSLVAASGGHSSSRCTGLSLSWPLLLQSTGSRRAGSVVVAHGPSCSTACGIFPDQG